MEGETLKGSQNHLTASDCGCEFLAVTSSRFHTIWHPNALEHHSKHSGNTRKGQTTWTNDLQLLKISTRCQTCSWNVLCFAGKCTCSLNSSSCYCDVGVTIQAYLLWLWVCSMWYADGGTHSNIYTWMFIHFNSWFTLFLCCIWMWCFTKPYQRQTVVFQNGILGKGKIMIVMKSIGLWLFGGQCSNIRV